MGTMKNTGEHHAFDPLKAATTLELIEELASRNKGHVIGISLNGSEGEYITKIGIEDVLTTVGLIKTVSKRMDIYLEDSIREEYDDED